MSNEVATIEKTNGQVQKSSEWTADQVKLIKDTVAKGTTNDEFRLFAYMASKYQLDPLIRQIWCVKYGTAPATMFAGRDGFLSIAHRSKQFNGMKTEPTFQDGKIFSATCYVYRKDMEHPVEVTVYLSEYNTGKSNWAKMPITMLCKVAESQALRKAFDISGIYAEEEQGAIQASAVDANHSEVLSEEIQRQIDECQSEDELKRLWTDNKALQGKTYFKQAVNVRKTELSQPKAQEEPDSTFENPPLSEEVQHAILICEDMKSITEVYNAYPELHDIKEFNSAINAQKISIGKKLSKKVAS